MREMDVFGTTSPRDEVRVTFTIPTEFDEQSLFKMRETLMSSFNVVPIIEIIRHSKSGVDGTPIDVLKYDYTLGDGEIKTLLSDLITANSKSKTFDPVNSNWIEEIAKGTSEAEMDPLNSLLFKAQGVTEEEKEILEFVMLRLPAAIFEQNADDKREEIVEFLSRKDYTPLKQLFDINHMSKVEAFLRLQLNGFEILGPIKLDGKTSNLANAVEVVLNDWIVRQIGCASVHDDRYVSECKKTVAHSIYKPLLD